MDKQKYGLDLAGGGQREEVYDWLRLIATIFVVIGHSAYLNIQTTFGGISYELPENISIVYNSALLEFCRNLSSWVYGFHMPLFFMLSGAVLGLKPIGDFDRFITSKIKRLLVPYFVYGWIFMLPVKYIGGFYNKESFYQALRGFLIGQESGHLWFLTALFWCMIIFTIIIKIICRYSDSKYMLLIISGIIQLLYVYLPIDVLGLKTGLSYIFWFALGYVFEKERKVYGLWNIKKVIIASIIITFIEIMERKYSILNGFFVVICGSLYTFLLADLLSRILKKITVSMMWKITIRNLFYVYLFHDPLEYVVLRLFMECNWLSSAVGCYTYTFCRTVAVFIFSMLLGEVILCFSKWLNSLNQSIKI